MSPWAVAPRALPSFPTRRSSDLRRDLGGHRDARPDARTRDGERLDRQDRKSTRLNSSHQIISYAVFCLKKKKNQTSGHHLHRKTSNLPPAIVTARTDRGQGTHDP